MVKILALGIALLMQVIVFSIEGYRIDFCADNMTGLFGDPDDCSKFYQCFFYNAYQFSCGAALFYNEELSVCDWPSNVVCGQRPTPSLIDNSTGPTSQLSNAPTSPTSRATTQKTATLSDGNLPRNATQTPNPPSRTFCETKSDYLYADSYDCRSFYQCSGTFTYHMTCQSGLLFNPVRQYCDWEWNVSCGESR